MPDLFVPLDTLEYSPYYKKLSRVGVFNDFALRYVEENRAQIKADYPSIRDFKDDFGKDNKYIDEFIAYAAEKDSAIVFTEEDYKISGNLIETRLKALIASNVWDYSAFYEVFNMKNEIFMAAYKMLSQGKYDDVYLTENKKK